MAAETSKGSGRAKKQETSEVTFKCRICQMQRPISEMKIITRFRPVMVVCQSCEKDIR